MYTLTVKKTTRPIFEIGFLYSFFLRLRAGHDKHFALYHISKRRKSSLRCLRITKFVCMTIAIVVQHPEIKRFTTDLKHAPTRKPLRPEN